MVTVVEGNPKASFSIATTPGCTPSTRLLHFTLDTYLIMLNVKQGGIKYHFLSLWYDVTWDWTLVSQAIGDQQFIIIKNNIATFSVTKNKIVWIYKEHT